MRGIMGTLVVLLALGYYASHTKWLSFRDAGAGTSLPANEWRRTAQGWEQRADWAAPARMYRESIASYVRPWTIAALQVLVSLLAFRLACPSMLHRRAVTPRRVDAVGSPLTRTA